MRSRPADERSLDVDIEPETEETPTPRRGRAAVLEADADDEVTIGAEDEGEGEVLLTNDGVQQGRVPLFEFKPPRHGVKVVYIGPDPFHAPTFKGRVSGENVGGVREESRGPEGQKFIKIVGGTLVKKADRGNFTNYDFRARDQAGVKSSKRMPATHKLVEVRDRPWQPVEHGEHAYQFSRRPQDYHLVILPDSFYQVREFIAAKERARKAHRKFVEETTAV